MQNLASITGEISAHVMQGKLADKFVALSKAARDKELPMEELITLARLAVFEKQQSPATPSLGETTLLKRLGPELTPLALDFGRLSMCMEAFAYGQSGAAIKPLDMQVRIPARSAEKQLTSLIMEMGGIGEQQAKEAVRRCRTCIEGALAKTVMAM